MANYIVKIYNQTGFDTCNVPDSPRMIESNFTPYKEYTTFELVQGRYLSTLRVQLTAIEANKIDLVTVSSDLINDTTVYTVNGYNMCAPDVCEFQLLLEPYSTLGGFGYDSGNWVLNGTMKRCHVSVEDDNKNFYTLPEPFENREPIEWTVSKLTPDSEYFTFIETLSIPSKIITQDCLATLFKAKKLDVAAMSNSNITRQGAYTGNAVIYDTSNKNAFSYQYMESVCARNLVSTILIPPNNKEITLGTRWWRADKVNWELDVFKIQTLEKEDELVQVHEKGSLTSDLVSDGRAGDISAIWEVPKSFCTIRSTKLEYDPTVEENYGGIDSILENTRSGSIALTKWATTTYNNKINYGQDLMIKVYNPASGSSSEHQVTEIMTPSSAAEWISSVPFTLMADLRPTGSPIFMFNYLNKADNVSNMIEVVKGGQWRQVALTDTGTMSKMDMIHQENQDELYRFDKFTKKINNIVANFNDAMNMIDSIQTPNTAVGIVPSAMNIFNRTREVWRNNIVHQQQNEELSAKATMASVNLNRESTTFANDMDKNGFFAIVSHFSNNDLMAFDTFLTRYGYNVGNMPFDGDQTYFYNRPSYNFVQVNDMTVESVTGNVNLVNDCVERLKQGLRIWHVKPNAKDMLAGGNR